MKSSGLLKWLLIPIVLLAVFVGIRWVSSDSHSSGATSPDRRDGSHLTAEEMKALGIEGDTPRDTVATLVAQVKQLRSELQAALNDNKTQKTENERLRLREAGVDQRIQTALSAERDRWRVEREEASGEQQQTQSLLEDLKRRLDTFSDKGSHADLPVGIGLEDEDAAGFNANRLRWVEPQGAHPAERKGSPPRRAPSENGVGPTTGFGPAPDRTPESLELTDTRGETERPRSEPPPAKPVYTVPSNATLIGSTAMTALIGRVPIDGTVNDPYPFKVLIGAENLTANGIDLPDVAGAVISGTASGDWTLSCVRGQIRSVTFVFQDGTIRTMTASSSATSDAGDGLRTGLGWISDPYGIPCVSGARRSNAQQYLSSQMLITAAGAGAASLIDSSSANVSYINGNNGNALGTVGITGNEAMGRILAGGVQEMSQWVNKLYGQAFAAIYVPPGAKVAVHLEQPLEIDYEPQGRKVNHRSGEAHVPDLD